MCELNVKREHVCSNYKGSSGNMEAVGALEIFERSLIKRDLQYTEYYGDGDSKGILQNYYGIAIRSNVGCLEKMQSAVIAAPSFTAALAIKIPCMGNVQQGKTAGENINKH
ncbi:uncharacterized protein TNCV_3904691 [Trichonephila clavipes]|nr:uncharacterized protein TNCV_3904691 [Trichonephila clavipes]